MLNLKDQKNTAFVLMGPLAIVAVFGAFALVASFMVINLNQERVPSRDARIQAQLSQLRGLAEIHFNTENTYEGLCVDDLTKDLLTDIKDQTGLEPQCFAVKESYCISSQLFSDPAKYVCIDSRGGWEKPSVFLFILSANNGSYKKK